MIQISPKALRFARLAAEHQSAFSNDAEVLVIEGEENRSRRHAGAGHAQRYVSISEQTAEFCVRAMTSLLDTPELFASHEWDGNDFAFMQAVTTSLREQLDRSDAQVR